MSKIRSNLYYVLYMLILGGLLHAFRWVDLNANVYGNEIFSMWPQRLALASYGLLGLYFVFDRIVAAKANTSVRIVCRCALCVYAVLIGFQILARPLFVTLSVITASFFMSGYYLFYICGDIKALFGRNSGSRKESNEIDF